MILLTFPYFVHSQHNNGMGTLALQFASNHSLLLLSITLFSPEEGWTGLRVRGIFSNTHLPFHLNTETNSTFSGDVWRGMDDGAPQRSERERERETAHAKRRDWKRRRKWGRRVLGWKRPVSEATREESPPGDPFILCPSPPPPLPLPPPTLDLLYIVLFLPSFHHGDGMRGEERQQQKSDDPSPLPSATLPFPPPFPPQIPPSLPIPSHPNHNSNSSSNYSTHYMLLSRRSHLIRHHLHLSHWSANSRGNGTEASAKETKQYTEHNIC
ncbi:hypothetical protein niasHT_039770 [Heterodera trifolii]|uniref:Uncharacterized protein n=1 Tax=Heterodera trifolii TaxID=157864 RepID=A0ABD2IYK7_9BILA